MHSSYSLSPSFVITLLCHPRHPILTPSLVTMAAKSVKAQSVKWLAESLACDLFLPPNSKRGNHSNDQDSTQDLIQNLTKDSEPVQILSQLLHSYPIDMIVQATHNRRKKLLLADMDSTIISQESLDEIAKAIHKGAIVETITQRAMNGEIPFEDALKERVALLQDLPLTLLDEILAKRIHLTSGAYTLVHTMRAHGAYTALVSGGFTYFSQKIAADVGFHENHANILEHDGKKLTGSVLEPILGRQAKLETLKQLCKQYSLQPSDVIAVGDGANDLDMLQNSGMGVAFHAKPLVIKLAPAQINHGDLTALLYIQGYSQTEFCYPPQAA